MRLFLVECALDAAEVRLSLAVGRHAAETLDALGTGVVGSQSQNDVVVVALEQFAQVARTCVDILPRIENVLHAEARRA